MYSKMPGRMTIWRELMKLFLPDMVAIKSGKVLNVSSTAAIMPGPLQAVYYATKAYMTSMDTNDITYLLGYQELNSFLRAFATWTGVTASEFRKQG